MTCEHERFNSIHLQRHFVPVVRSHRVNEWICVPNSVACVHCY